MAALFLDCNVLGTRNHAKRQLQLPTTNSLSLTTTMSFIPPSGCSIPANPDISGIGVRVAIYAQNLLSFIPALWALWDGHVSDYELESVETQSTTILVTAFAILFSAMAQAQDGLSNFHATIVLDLSWMNNTNTFIYFLLYVQYKSQAGPEQIRPNLTAWMNHVKDKLSGRLSSVEGLSSDDAEGSYDLLLLVRSFPTVVYSTKFQLTTRRVRRIEIAPAGYNYLSYRKFRNTDPCLGQDKSVARQLKLVFGRIVLFLGSLHLMIMAALGMWLWSNPRAFGSSANSCVVDIASTVILGKSIPLNSSALRALSITIYSLFLVPGLNLVLPMALFLGIFLAYHKWFSGRPSEYRQLADHTELQDGHLSSSPGILPTVIGMGFLFVVDFILLVDIELTLRRNQLQTSSESNWTFGQILAMLLLVLPLRDLIETLLARRETRRLEDLARRDKQRIDEHTLSLRTAIKANTKTEVLRDLIEKGADVNVEVEGAAIVGIVNVY